MLLKTLKGRHYLLLFLVPVFLLLLWIEAFISPVSLTGEQNQMPLYSMLQSLTQGSIIALNIVGGILLILLSLLVVRLNEKYIFIRQRTDLPAFIFALIATGTVSLYGMHPALLASFLLFFAIDSIFAIYHGSRTLAKSFEVGLFIGLASISYLFSAVFILWFWIGLAFLGYFRAREILAGLVGFLLPIFITASWFYLNDDLGVFLQSINALIDFEFKAEYSLFQKVYWGILAAFVLLASAFMANVVEEKKISSRKYFMILFVFFITTIGSFFVFSGTGTELYFLLLIPVTFIISHYFVLSRYSWIGEVLFAIFVGASILIHFVG
ncbi:DUF6427 family protein [Marinifilum caeruleilacunae]|uniref:Uncharacterized protein n=1 Tax=Marinifilum caeruleilacunae TaxID=2499076 RepID=A0ABX1WWV6_9BACT|nr:DUF6427 family protein [Marinifilum caeruleilacunae]NOU60564.1 hypothetical protein [Marinifilum caeruleilacunae]